MGGAVVSLSDNVNLLLSTTPPNTIFSDVLIDRTMRVPIQLTMVNVDNDHDQIALKK